MEPVDPSNGWEAAAQAFIRDGHRSTVGVSTVEAWVRTLPARARVLDLACGPGTPRSEVLANKGFALHAIIPRIARALRPGGSFLFTAPWQVATWEDLTTKRPSLSLGEAAYKALLADAGLRLRAEYDDEGENHYYEALKR